jgi:hypothetical protein
MCRQCGDPKCVSNCPAAALAKDYASGVIDWDGDEVRELPAVHRRLRLRRHRLQRRGRPCRQVRHLRRRSGLRQGLRPHGALKLPHHRQHLQRGRRPGGPVRAGPGRLPGLQHRAHHAPHPAPHRARYRAGHAAGLHPGHGLGRLQRHHRHQGAGLPPAAHQHRADAGRRQAPLQAPGPRGERPGAWPATAGRPTSASSRSPARPSAASRSSSSAWTTRAT